MVVKEWLPLLTGRFLASVVVIFVVRLAWVVTYVRLHHPVANHQFTRWYRAEPERLLSYRVTVEMRPPLLAPPVIRCREPASAGGCPTTAPVGSTHERPIQ
jgi:hypothetical protein